MFSVKKETDEQKRCKFIEIKLKLKEEYTVKEIKNSYIDMLIITGEANLFAYLEVNRDPGVEFQRAERGWGKGVPYRH